MAFDGLKRALFDDGDKKETVEDGFYTVSNKQLKEEEGKSGSKMILVEKSSTTCSVVFSFVDSILMQTAPKSQRINL